MITGICKWVDCESLQDAVKGKLSDEYHGERDGAQQQFAGRGPGSGAPIGKTKRKCAEQGNDCETKAGAGTRHRLSRQEQDDKCETADRGHDRGRIIRFPIAPHPGCHGSV